MATDKANSATVTFATVLLGKVQDISAPISATEINVDAIGDTEQIREPGFLDKPVEVTVFGIPDVDVGDKGALVIAWGDLLTTTDSYTNYCCFAKDRGGVKDGMITTKLTFKKSNAA